MILRESQDTWDKGEGRLTPSWDDPGKNLGCILRYSDKGGGRLTPSWDDPGKSLGCMLGNPKILGQGRGEAGSILG